MAFSQKTAACLLTGSSLLLAATPMVQALAVPQGGDSAEGTSVGATVASVCSDSTMAALGGALCQVEDFQGEFSWTQDVAASNDYLARYLYTDTKHLCGSEEIESGLTLSADDAVCEVGSIRVSGAIPREFVVEVEEYQQKAPVRAMLGCTCSGNHHDGHATGNAQVGGFRLDALIEEAQPDEAVNTIVFSSADGYSAAFPLSYVTQRYSIIVTEINGEPLADVAGCENQLWLSTSTARNFLKDVVSISFEVRDEVPEVPSAASAPAVGLLEGQAE